MLNSSTNIDLILRNKGVNLSLESGKLIKF